jgi:hypothetical protein
LPQLTKTSWRPRTRNAPSPPALPGRQGQLVERRSKQQLRTMSVEWLAITDRSTTNVDFGVVPTGIEPVTFRV